MAIDEVFGENSIMHQVARCESSYRHLNASGEVIRGAVNPNDIGLFQVNETIWGEKAKALNLNIYELRDNVRMAKVIMDTQGILAWSASKFCWNR